MNQTCPRCNALLSPDARYCHNCGTALAAASSTPDPVEPDEGYARLYPEEHMPKSSDRVAPSAPAGHPPVPSEIALPSARNAAPFAPGPEEPIPPQDEPSLQDGDIDQNADYVVPRRPFWPWLLAGVIFAGLGLTAYGYMQDGRSLTPISETALEKPAASPPSPTIVEPHTSYYVTADANVRNKPTTAGTSVISKLTRGSQASGDVVAGAKGQQWLKLEGKEAYVSLVNLARSAPPVLVSSSATDTRIVARCAVLTQPDSGAPVKVTLDPGAKIKITGLTENGYAEFALPRGGAGYVEQQGTPCLDPVSADPLAPDDDNDGEGAQPDLLPDTGLQDRVGE